MTNKLSYKVEHPSKESILRIDREALIVLSMLADQDIVHEAASKRPSCNLTPEELWKFWVYLTGLVMCSDLPQEQVDMCAAVYDSALDM